MGQGHAYAETRRGLAQDELSRTVALTGDDKSPELVIDFLGGAVRHRLMYGGGRGQALPKAAGFSRGNTPSIVDATAGFGRDAFLLASLGAEITLIERSPEIHAKLQEALALATNAGPKIAEIITRMTLLSGDSRELLPGLNPDVVFVDPMHPPRHNSALVKKEMRVLRQWVGSDDDAVELMKAALSSAKKRVVLKWPRRGESLPGLREPSHQIIGKSTRYDVFMI